MVTRLNMIILMQPDLPAAVDFYEKLGLKKIFHIKGQWAEFEVGSTKVGLCPTDSEQRPVRTGIVFEVADLKALHQTLKAEGRQLTDVVERPHGFIMSIQDPGGNLIDFYQPTPEKLKEFVDRVVTKEDDADDCCKPQKVDTCCSKK